MTDFAALARSALEVAERVAPILPGATDDLAVAAARALVNMIDRVGELTNASAEDLASMRAEVESRVLRGLREEAAALRG